MMENQRTQDDNSRGSRVFCTDCGTIYDPRRPSTHPIEECEALRRRLDLDSTERLPSRADIEAQIAFEREHEAKPPQ
jgi:hypothetical protein